MIMKTYKIEYKVLCALTMHVMFSFQLGLSDKVHPGIHSQVNKYLDNVIGILVFTTIYCN